jgi:hypothetical protein
VAIGHRAGVDHLARDDGREVGPELGTELRRGTRGIVGERLCDLVGVGGGVHGQRRRLPDEHRPISAIVLAIAFPEHTSARVGRG